MSEQYSRKSYIKDICLELPGYQFRHKSFSGKDKDNFEFIGRDIARQQIKDIILNGKNNGAYLVAGYRGMGKTSFVNKVLEESNAALKERRGWRLKQVNVSFGKSSLVYSDLLRQLIVSLMNNVTGQIHRPLIWLIKPSHTFIIAAILFIATMAGLFIYPEKVILYIPQNFRNLTFLVLSAAAVAFSLAFLTIKLVILFVGRLPSIRRYDELSKLYTRSKAEISEEENIQSIVKSINFGLFSKTSSKYSPMTSKEIELELIRIINKIDRTGKPKWLIGYSVKFLNWVLAKVFRYYRENNYVFVFDELDKIDPGVGGEDYYKEMKDFKVDDQSKTYIDDQRDRRQMMLNIISSLKHLITESGAKFVFITGREMFEASLADIADRQFSLGSIFHKIIYIDSFLKDKKENDPAGLSNLTENYLKSLLLPQKYIAEWKNKGGIWKHSLLYLYHDYLNASRFWNDSLPFSSSQTFKIIQTLQQFIIYLTYRTNGSPKKLSRLVEDFIINKSIIPEKLIDPKLRVEQKPKRNNKHKDVLYLRLSYDDQARFGFIDYLYRPFLLNYNKRLKNNSDYLLVSTTYLVDHILKFHPVAFSTRNLELLPEVLSTNRTPQLRNFIDDLILFLSYSYIRDTEINLFDYKFHNKVANEVYFLTNMFEQESAAFNFTLDESYPIKIHIRNKILELRKIHKDYKSSSDYEFIHSISGLNNLLGDIRYYDQEYTDAITAYSDSLQALRNISDSLKQRIEMVILIIQLQLKIGLTFEKIKTYENAMAYFTDAMEYSREIVMDYCAGKSKELQQVENATVPQGKQKDHFAAMVSLNELLQNSIQAFVANLYLIEKMSPEGINAQKINQTVCLMDGLFTSVDTKNNTLLSQSGFYSHLAVLVFYKNLFVPEINKHPELTYCNKELYLDESDSLVSQRKPWPDNDNFRFPNLSFYLSCLALKKVLEHFKFLRHPGNHLLSPIRPERLLLESIQLIISPDIHELSNKNSLSSIATILARIGDILLTNIEQDPTTPSDHGSVALTSVFSEYLKAGYEAFDKDKITAIDLMNSFYIDDDTKNILNSGITGALRYRIQLILVCYLLSSKYYSAAGKMANCSFQLKRMLRVLLSVVYIGLNKDKGGSATRQVSKAQYYQELIELIEKLLLAEILKNISTNSNSTDRSQILRYKHYTREGSVHYPVERSKYIYGNLSNSPEIREAIILFAKIKMLATPLSSSLTAELEDLIDEQSIVTPNNLISHQWTRILELEFQASLNWKIFKEVIDPGLFALFPGLLTVGKSFRDCWLNKIYKVYSKTDETLLIRLRANTISRDEYLEISTNNLVIDHVGILDNEGFLYDFFQDLHAISVSSGTTTLITKMLGLVANSVHSLNHIIEILQTYGNSYPASHSFTGDQYCRLGKWMQLFHLGLEFQHVHRCEYPYKLKQELEFLVGVEPLRILEPTILFQTAMLNYHRAIELHHDGNTYKNKIKSLNYLDDDFNDSVDHFEAALERQRINSGNIRRKILELSQFIDKSQLFKYRSYVNNVKGY